MNLLIFITAFASQYFIGAVIEIFPTTPSGGYAIEGYRLSFSLCLAAQVIGLVWYLFGFSTLRSKPAGDGIR